MTEQMRWFAYRSVAFWLAYFLIDGSVAWMMWRTTR